MNRISREEIWLLSSVAKWSVFATVTGIVVGSAAAGFINLLAWSSAVVARLGMFRFFALFPGLLISYYCVRIFTKGARVNVVKAIHNDFGEIEISAIPVRLFATVITIASGGSAGKEGPCATIGAGIMDLLSRIFDLNAEDKKKLVTIGSAAGISAVFGTPLAGAIFGIEMLYMGEIFYNVLFPVFIAGIISSMTALYWGAGHLPFVAVNVAGESLPLLFWSLILGVLFGVIALCHVECIHRIDRAFQKMNVPHWTKPLIGAAILFVTALVFGDHYFGLKSDIVTDALNGKNIQPVAFILKSLALSVTLGCGGTGGVLMPTMFVGAAAGSVIARVLGINMAAASALGFVSLLAGATSTPIASTVLAIELFGGHMAPFAGISCCTAYVIAGHRSLYSGQLMRPKTDLFVQKVRPDGTDVVVERFHNIPFRRVARFQFRQVRKKITDVLRTFFFKGRDDK